MRPLALGVVSATLAIAAQLRRTREPAPPDAATCAKVRAKRTAPPVVTYDRKPRAIRVFAMQFKQEVRHIETYAAFRVKIECMVREYVKPRLARGRGMVNVVAFNEDIGLMTAGTGRAAPRPGRSSPTRAARRVARARASPARRSRRSAP